MPHPSSLPGRSGPSATAGRASRRRAGLAVTAAALTVATVAGAGPALADPSVPLTPAEVASSGHARARALLAAAVVAQTRSAVQRAQRSAVPPAAAWSAREADALTLPAKTAKARKPKAPRVRTPPPVVTPPPPPVVTTPPPVVTPPPPPVVTPPPAPPVTPPSAPAASTGTVFYVDPAGDDAHDGRSPATALRTLAAVSALDLEPGDEVRLLGGGVFPGPLLLGPEDAGTASAPVRITGWNGRATIDAGTGSGVVVQNAGGVQVSGLTVTGRGQVGTDLRGVGVLFYTDLDGGVRLPAVGVSDVDVSGFGDAGVQVGAWNASWSGFSGVSLTGVTAHDNGDAGISTFGWWAPRSRQYSLTDVTVERSRAYGNRGIAGKGTDSGSGISLGGVLRGTVRASEAYANGADNDATAATAGPAGVLVWDSAEVTVVDSSSHDNRSRTAGGSGFALAGGVLRSALTRNTSSGNHGPGLLVHQPAGFRPTEGNAVSRNVSTGDGLRSGAGLEIAGPAEGTGVKDTDVFLNTVVVIAADGAVPSAVRISDPVDTAAVHDNVLVARGGAVLAEVGGGSDRLLFDRNTWISGADGPVVLWDGTRFTSLEAWRAATGQEPTTV